MHLRRTKTKLVLTGAVAAMLIGGGVSIAAASSPASSPAGTPATTGEQDGTDTTFTGSVQAPAEQADGQETAGSNDQEQAALQALATVPQAQAEAAALAAVPGTVAGADLGNENGFVVYSVEVNAADGTVTEVTVDAGNATVLAQQAQDASDPADAPDAPESAGDQQD
jgi:uncharacterized membrane protein YkoI